MQEIILFYFGGKIKDRLTPTPFNIRECHALKVRLTMKDGSVKEGFANTHCTWPERHLLWEDKELEALDFLVLEKYIHIDEATQTFTCGGMQRNETACEQIMYADIEQIEAIAFSGIRWGAKPTNKFDLSAGTPFVD